MRNSERSGELLAKAKLIGFETLSYDNQYVIFNKARLFGWSGEVTPPLGTPDAYKALEQAIEYLLAQGVKFQRER